MTGLSHESLCVQADIEVQWAITPRRLPTESDCQNWVMAALQGERRKQAVAMTIRIVDEAESQLLTREYRAMDKPTNVLSFEFDVPPGYEAEEDEALYLGDLVICADIVEREALDQHKALQAHWAHLVVHGTLHLQGYDHIEEAQAEQMEALEVKILQQLGFENPY